MVGTAASCMGLVAVAVCDYYCTVLLFETKCPRLGSPSLASSHAPAVEVRQDHAAGLGCGLGGATSHVELDEKALCNLHHTLS